LDKIRFIDGLTRGSLGEAVLETPKASMMPAQAVDLSTLSSLLTAIETQMHSSSTSHLIVDDMGILLALGFDLHFILKFTLALRKLTTDNGMTLVIRVQKDGMDHDPALKHLIHHLINQSNIVLESVGLSTGISNDIDGQLCLRRGAKWIDCQTPFHPQTLHFKITDNNVRLIGRGLSSSVV
jgi:hypothetical protein